MFKNMQSFLMKQMNDTPYFPKWGLGHVVVKQPYDTREI